MSGDARISICQHGQLMLVFDDEALPHVHELMRAGFTPEQIVIEVGERMSRKPRG